MIIVGCDYHPKSTVELLRFRRGARVAAPSALRFLYRQKQFVAVRLYWMMRQEWDYR
jgi:hypothetical protein